MQPKQQKLKYFSNYTFFLVPRSNWLEDQSDRAINDLYEAYKIYGAYIGDGGLAVWLWKGKKPDEKRATELAYKLGLDINKGPYIVYRRLENQNNTTLINESSEGEKTIKTKKRDLVDAITASASEQFILDMQDCGMEGTTNVLRWMAMAIQSNQPIEKNNPIGRAKLDCQVDIYINKTEKALEKTDRILGLLESIVSKIRKIFQG
jgi:hypothetical protein